jgi:hypothetical protein
MLRTVCVLALLGAFPVEATVEIVPQGSAVFKLDNCLLWCNPDLYRTISRYFVLVVLSLVLLVVDRHLSKLIGFVMSSGLLKSASMDLSPIEMVSVKLEIVI